jgi:hypothetical protein
LVGRCADRSLARKSHQIGSAAGDKALRVLENAEIVLKRLPKTETRVPANLLEPHALSQKSRFTGLEVRFDFAQQILVIGAILHGLRRSLHVHDHESCAALCGHLFGAGQFKGANIIENAGAGFETGLHHLGLTCVNRHGETLSGELAHHGHHAVNFLFHTDFSRSRSRRFAAHVQNVGSLLGQALAPGHGRFKFVVRTAVGKRVGRHVHDTHDQRPRQVQHAVTALPRRHTLEIVFLHRLSFQKERRDRPAVIQSFRP